MLRLFTSLVRFGASVFEWAFVVPALRLRGALLALRSPRATGVHWYLAARHLQSDHAAVVAETLTSHPQHVVLLLSGTHTQCEALVPALARAGVHVPQASAARRDEAYVIAGGTCDGEALLLHTGSAQETAPWDSMRTTH